MGRRRRRFWTPTERGKHPKTIYLSKMVTKQWDQSKFACLKPQKPPWFTKIPGEAAHKNDKSSRTPEIHISNFTVLSESECTNSIQLNIQHRSLVLYIYPGSTIFWGPTMVKLQLTVMRLRRDNYWQSGPRKNIEILAIPTYISRLRLSI